MNAKTAPAKLQTPASQQEQLEKDHAAGVGGSYSIDPVTRKPVSVERSQVVQEQDASPNAHRRPPAQLVDAAGKPVDETPVV